MPLAPGVAPRRFTKTEREHLKTEVLRLDRRRYNQFQIARELGISQSMVSKFLSQAREEFKNQRQASKEEDIAEKRAQHGDVQHEAWEAFRFSKGEVVGFIKEAIREALEDSEISGNPLPENLRIHLDCAPEMAA